jgi:L-alanine-DL-glutamate epimerase-like enolase superfamily enzyme
MKITKIETIPMTIPWEPIPPGRTPGSQSRGRFQETAPEGAHFFILKIYTDEGIIGLGDSWYVQPKCEHLFIDEHLAPAILGMDPFDVTRIHARMQYFETHLFERLGPMREAEAAIDLALYDIMGKAVGKPVYKLIGGAVREVVPLEPRDVPGVTTPIDEMVEIAQHGYEMGHRAFRIKVGTDVDMEVKRIRALRETLGEDVKLHVDANQGWTPKVAIKCIKKMDKYDLYCVEQPVAFADLEGMAFVRRSVDPIVMADESIGSPRDALNLIRNEAADAFHLYLTKSPGIYHTMKIATIAEYAGISCWLHGPGTLSWVAAIHVSAAIKNLMLGVSRRPLVPKELLAEPPKITPKGIEVPKEPGLGVDFDWEEVEKYRRKN